MRTYKLPMLSGVLCILVFYPFYIWPLALVALAPLFYFARADRSGKELFWGGFLCGVLAVTPTLFFSLFQLVPQPGAPLLTLAVRASSVFFFLFIGSLFGGLALGTHALRSRSSLINGLTAAALYTVLELILFAAFGGYYYASLAHALAPFPPALWLSAWGGVPLVIFAAAWLSAALAEKSWQLVLGGLAVLAVLAGGQAFFAAHAPVRGSLSVALMQRQIGDLYGLLVSATAPFDDPALRALIAQAAAGTQLVVYPLSPVEATYRGQMPAIPGLTKTAPDGALGEWLNTFVPASTTVMLWNTVAQSGGLYDEFEFWDGGKNQEYQKHRLYALSDYTPGWLRALGLARLPYEITPGTLSTVSLGGVRLGGLACSELQQESYVRWQAAYSDVLVSTGFDGFFPGKLPVEWSLEAARLRAAENGTPLIRAHLFGPSALVDASGAVLAGMPYGASGIVRGTMEIKKIPTLYSRAGALPAYALVFGSLALALYRRFKSRDSAGL